MPKAFITGASGFVGPYLARHLKTLGYQVWGSSLSQTRAEDYESVILDIQNAEAVKKVVASISPDEIYHLASLSRPALGLIREYYDVNLQGTLNVLEAAKAVNAKTLIVSTAYVYGRYNTVISETTPLEPVNHYGASKAAADLAAISYALDGLHVVRVRPFNHSGPGQSPDFVLPSLIHQVAKMEAGLSDPVLHVGNLDSVRDFCDVRDIVMAYPLLLQKGQSGGVYNLASGRGVSIRELVAEVTRLSSKDIEVVQQASRSRPQDIPYLVGDVRSAKELMGWQTTYTLEKMLQDMMDAEKENLNA
ncbi:MAG: GDP-mannose 4,6-dehydratase [Trueperaceae bacterium]